MAMFHVGQKVVCVDDRGTSLVRAGHEYIVRETQAAYLCLHGVRGTVADGMFATRFRPVIERKTNISVFTALLDPANHKHLEDVR